MNRTLAAFEWPRGTLMAAAVPVGLAGAVVTIYLARLMLNPEPSDPIAIFAGIGMTVTVPLAGVAALIAVGVCLIRLYEAWRSTIAIPGEDMR